MKIKEYFSRFSLQDLIFIVFSFLWIGVIMLDYMNKQVIYTPSIKYFKYWNLLLFFILFGGLLSAAFCQVGPFKNRRIPRLNGMTIFILFLLIIYSVTIAFSKYWPATLDFSNYLHLTGKGLFTIGCTFFMTVGVYSAGQRIRKFFIPEMSPITTQILIDISIGFAAYTLVLMILGALGQLNQITVLALLLLFIAINYKAAWNVTLKLLWHPVLKPKDLSFWGAFVAFLVLVFVTMNYFYTQAPFPLGFDSRNYYVNIPKLISEAEALIPGFQPYAWGLVMSTGYVAFNSSEITLFISALGGLLSLFAIYHLSRHYLKIPSNSSWLVVFLFLLTPTVTNHFMIEFKIDLALVFYQVVILTFILWWLFENDRDNQTQKNLLGTKQDIYIISIIGILMGYCISIKVLSVFLIFGIYLGLWSYYKNFIGVLSFSAISLGMILIAGLDNVSGLRAYHHNPTQTGIILASLGALGLAYSLFKESKSSIIVLKTIVLSGIFSLLMFSPWMYKNYSYTKSLSITKLLMGEKPRPALKSTKRIRNENNRRNNEGN